MLRKQFGIIFKIFFFILLFFSFFPQSYNKKSSLHISYVPNYSFISNSSLILDGNDQLDSFFAGNVTNGLSESTAYIIEHLVIDTSELAYGIKISNTDRFLKIRYCTLVSSDSTPISTGIAIYNSAHITIQNCNITNNAYGINMDKSSLISVINNDIFDNINDGIALINSNNNTLSGNYAINNGGNGFRLHYSDNNIFSNSIQNKATHNTENGILLSYSEHNTIFGLNSSYNRKNGLYLLKSNNNLVEHNYFNFNGENCIQVDGNDNTISDNPNCDPVITSPLTEYFMAFMFILLIAGSVFLIIKRGKNNRL